MIVHPGLLRSRYYFAYYLSESINNLAGLGFDGVDCEGKENWDLINNVEIKKVSACASPSQKRDTDHFLASEIEGSSYDG